jgi:hypothetical protein
MSTGVCVPWWSDKLAGDGDVHANLARHFLGCGERGVEDLTALLLEFRWTERQLAVNGMLSLRADFDHLGSALPFDPMAVDGGASCDGVGEADMWTALDVLSAAVQLAGEKGQKNPRELAFQMHGRLFARRSELALVDKYVSSVELHAERPWLCAICPFLEQAGGHLVASSSVGFHVLCVELLPVDGHVLAGGCEGSMAIVGTAAGGIAQRLQGHKGDVKSMAVSADGAHIVSCGTDGTVRVWDAEIGAAMGEPLLGHEGRVLSVVLSTDASRIASCDSDGTVRIWDAVNGVAVGEPLRGHQGIVRSVAITGDGEQNWVGRKWRHCAGLGRRCSCWRVVVWLIWLGDPMKMIFKAAVSLSERKHKTTR